MTPSLDARAGATHEAMKQALQQEFKANTTTSKWAWNGLSSRAREDAIKATADAAAMQVL